MQWATCWSELQKEELVKGSDWNPEHVHVGGIPSYDGYFRKQWLMPRDEYFKLHGLDPNRKLISYASSFVHFAPNFPNIEALAKLVSSDSLAEPSQLLIRLHPSHFQDKPKIFADERAQVFELEKKYPHVHVVQPVALGGSLGYYGGEDMDEKSSMMAYSDVVVTVYSTMLVETAVHDTPMIAAMIDTPGGWNKPKKFSLSLKEIGDWPTHKRFREAKAGRVATNEKELRATLNAYLKNPSLDYAERRKFIEDEITFTDGTSGKRTAEFILKVLKLITNNHCNHPTMRPRTKSMFLFYFSITLAICSSALYHFISQKHASKCEFHSISFSDLCCCVYRHSAHIFFLSHQKRHTSGTQTTQLGKHRTCHRHRRHRIWFPARLSFRLESRHRRGADQCGRVADFASRGDFLFQR